ncbi:DNA cytosine methyltransferase [Aulosira sp. FACHB-615]|uniref:DNA cytosine methyltransferase n=1 Tax=Aulosira sp. FACHB-615 TaxID=2692777 RepID=UPI001F559FDF|nr:DNA cytosine methyltransferase [Aulosira sp. FACHB-615]
MQAISLFSGIGGFEIAFHQVFPEGEVIQMVEIEPDAQTVLRSHFPETPIHPDIRTYEPDINWQYNEGIAFFGFPCRNTSNAGDRTGLSGEESSLWFEALRIIFMVKPRFILIENPTALINRGLRAVLGGLRMAGYTAEVEIVSAAELGAPHERERLFIIAYPHLWQQEKRISCGWASQIGGEIERVKADFAFPTIERRDDGFAYGFPKGLDSVSESVPSGTAGRIRSRYLYGRSVVPACAVVAFRRIKFLAGV